MDQLIRVIARALVDHPEDVQVTAREDARGLVYELSVNPADLGKVIGKQGRIAKALRTVVRTRDDVVAMRVAATNQLSALLDDHWPGAKAIFADVESPISLAFLRRYPTAASAARLGEKRLAAFLVKHSYSGRRPVKELLTRLRSAPAGTTDPVLTIAVRDVVLALVSVIEALNSAGKALDRSVIARLGEHPDAEVFTSLPRSGQINAAQVLAEWGDSRAAYDGPDAVAALAGVTPVTKSSGKQHAVHFR